MSSQDQDSDKAEAKQNKADAEVQEDTSAAAGQQDTAPAPEAKPAPALAKKQSPSGRSRSFMMPVITGLLLAGLGLLGYLHYELRSSVDVLFSQQNQLVSSSAAASQALNAREAELNSLRAEVQTLAGTLQLRSDQLEAQNGEIERLNDELINTRLRINTSNTGVNQQWLLAEAESQIRLAQQRLVVARDVRAAIALFVASDELLRRVDDTAVFTVRDVLARDLAALRAVPELDVQGLFLRLGALSRRIDMLPLVLSDADRLAGSEVVTSTQDVSEIGYFGELIERLGEYVTVRRLEQPIEPMLTSQEGFYIRQSIRLLLEQARLALLREEQEIFRGNITQAMMEIRTYMAEDPARGSVLSELSELEGARVAVQVPNVSGTLNAFRQVMASIGVDAPAEEAEN